MPRLKRMRERRGLTQDELAGLAGVSQSIISQYENEKRGMTMRILGKLAAALSCPISELLDPGDLPNMRSIELALLLEQQTKEEFPEKKVKKIEKILDLLKMELLDVTE